MNLDLQTLNKVFFGKTMIVFIVPLKSRTIATSWDRVSQLLERTLRSICSQSDENYRVVVVCNQLPNIKYSNQKIEFSIVDFSPKKQNDARKTRIVNENDKALRINVGLEVAKQHSPTHIMVVDADDCISNKIAEFVNTTISNHGWYVTKGYFYREKSKYLIKKNNDFQLVCGTALILRPDVLHQWMQKKDGYLHFRHEKTNIGDIALSPLPFPAAVYCISNGENFHMTSSRQKTLIRSNNINNIKVILKRISNYTIVPYRKKLVESYGLYSIVNGN